MAWTRTVAQEWAKYRITVNSVVPAIWTPMYDAYRARMSDQERMIHDMAMQHVVPLGGKLGDPDADAGAGDGVPGQRPVALHDRPVLRRRRRHDHAGVSGGCAADVGRRHCRPGSVARPRSRECA